MKWLKCSLSETKNQVVEIVQEIEVVEHHTQQLMNKVVIKQELGGLEQSKK